MEIVHYPHPTLRRKSKSISRVDSGLKSTVAEMFELMYTARGIGLAANQVDLPLRLFVINLAGEKGEGEEMVFINPVLDQPKGSETAEEGCLSIPGVNGNVNRPAQVHVSAYDLSGNEIDFTASGLLARAIQHEHDHLEGILFIDRISDSEKKQLAGELEEFELEFQSGRTSHTIPSEEEIARHWQAIEERYA